jgi:hypothetical protein
VKDLQPSLFAPWWSETVDAGSAGRHRFIRYRCARCELLSDPLNSSSPPPGACKKCTSLPLEKR